MSTAVYKFIYNIIMYVRSPTPCRVSWIILQQYLYDDVLSVVQRPLNFRARTDGNNNILYIFICTTMTTGFFPRRLACDDNSSSSVRMYTVQCTTHSRTLDFSTNRVKIIQKKK